MVRAEKRRKVLDGQFSTLDTDRVSGHNACGRFRLVRTGGRLYVGGDNETFDPGDRETAGMAATQTMFVYAAGSDDKGSVSAIISQLTVKA